MGAAIQQAGERAGRILTRRRSWPPLEQGRSYSDLRSGAWRQQGKEEEEDAARWEEFSFVYCVRWMQCAGGAGEVGRERVFIGPHHPGLGCSRPFWPAGEVVPSVIQRGGCHVSAAVRHGCIIRTQKFHLKSIEIINEGSRNWGPRIKLGPS